MADEDKRIHQWTVRLTPAQDRLVRDRMKLEGIDAQAWFVQACMAVVMHEVPIGGLAERIESYRPPPDPWVR